MKIEILDALKVCNNEFTLALEENPLIESGYQFQTNRNRMNNILGDAGVEIFYLHHIDRNDIRYLIYTSNYAMGVDDVNALEIALDGYLLKS